MTISEPIGCSNTYVLSVTKEIAEKYDLKTISDLIKNANQLRFGCTTEFTEREDLLPKLEKEYGVHFKAVTGLSGNIRYQAIASGEVDVTDAYETDAMVKKTDLVALEDDIGFFPPYQAVNIYNETLLEEYPELEEVLSGLHNGITTEEMLNMNYQVDVEGQKPEDVAHNFLIEKNLIEK